MTTRTSQDNLASKFLQTTTAVALALVGFITINALERISDLDEKINAHIITSEHRLTALEHKQ
tara:strand:+ start:452 stop:640 length:189 start_codon:yes stop_codon:yes gene_type:complete